MLFTCIAGAFTIMHKKATIVIYLVLQSTPTYIKEMAGYYIVAPKLEKQNTPAIETRNDHDRLLLLFLTSADSSTSEIFVDLWLSLDTSIGTFTMVLMT